MTLQIRKMVLALISVHKVFGVIVTIRHYLMFMSSSQMLPPTEKCSYHQHIHLHERQKQISYDKCIWEAEYGSFTPLVFPHQEEWGNVLLKHTRELPPFCLPRKSRVCSNHCLDKMLSSIALFHRVLERCTIIKGKGWRGGHSDSHCNRSSCCRSQGSVSICLMHLLHSLCAQLCIFSV